MIKSLLVTAAVTLAALPALAQTPGKMLTPPQVLGTAKTIQFTATEVIGGVAKQVSVASFAQPNKAIIQDMDAKTKIVNMVYASDGKTQTDYSHLSGQYTKSDAAAHFSDLQSHTLAFFALSEFLTPNAFAKFTHSATDLPGAYRMTLGHQGDKTIEADLAVTPATGLPASLLILIKSGTQPAVPAERILFTGWKLNAPIAGTKFAYTPPADAKLYVAPQLLANGTVAPDFTVQDKDGKPVKLSDYRGKTVVLDFWATWCGPCQMSLPHTTAMAKKYADKNVVVLAVNVWDKPAAFQAWLPKHPEYAPLNFAIDPNADETKSVASALYGVSGIPTQYIIGADGKIVKSIVGYDPNSTDLEDALKVSGS